MKTTEAKLKDDVRLYLTKIGAYWFMPVQTGYGQSTVDFLVCYKGRFYGIETKVRGRAPTPRQLQKIREIVAAGGEAFVAYDVEQVKAQLHVA